MFNIIASGNFMDRLKRAQIVRHFVKRLQQNRVGKFIASRIADTAERHGPDVSLSPCRSLSASYRSISSHRRTQ
jgi:hypothetical protein